MRGDPDAADDADGRHAAGDRAAARASIDRPYLHREPRRRRDRNRARGFLPVASARRLHRQRSGSRDQCGSVAVIAFWQAPRSGPNLLEPVRSVWNAWNAPSAAVPIYVAAGLSGFTAFGAEVVWTRQLSLLFGGSVYTFSLILAVFLGGLAIGGSIGARVCAPHARAGHGARTSATGAGGGDCRRRMVDRQRGCPAFNRHVSFSSDSRVPGAGRCAFDAFRCAVAHVAGNGAVGRELPAHGSPPQEAAMPAARSGRINALDTAGALAGALLLTLIGVPTRQHVAQQVLVVVASDERGLTMLLTSRGSSSVFSVVCGHGSWVTVGLRVLGTGHPRPGSSRLADR